MGLAMNSYSTTTPMSAQEFGELFTRFKTKFVRIAISYVRDAAVAEDIVADSFTNFWDKRGMIEISAVPEAYILTSIKNKCLNYLRDKATKMRIEQRMQENGYKAIMTEISVLNGQDMSLLFRSDVNKIFMNAMSELPQRTREIFFASRFEDMTYNEIADKYDITPRKVKREIQRTLEVLRISLKDYLPAVMFLTGSFLLMK